MAILHKTQLLSLRSILLLQILSSFPCTPCQGNRPPYMTSDLKEVSGKSFDYIIVGGGTAGCPLAATLSEKFSVLLVERGGSPYGNPLVMDRKYYGFSLLNTDEYSSVAQSFISTEGVPNHRGRVLGGSSAINGGFFSRANADFVKRVGWDVEQVEDAYRWVESRVVFQPELTPWQFVAEFGFLEAGIFPYNGYTLEHLEGTKIGGSVFDNYGTRHTSADLLEAGHTENLTVLLNSTVRNLLFCNQSDNNETRGNGIAFIKSDGSLEESYEAYLNRANDSTLFSEVILAAGSLGSPQILLLSGIGPPKHLKKFNISLLSGLRGVGRGMQDNPCVALLADAKPQNRLPEPPVVAGIAHDLKFIIEAGILPVSHNSTRMPVAVKYAFPASRGRLKLNSTDPRKNPTVTFNYLSKEEDMKACTEMAQLLQRVVRSQAVSVFLGVEHKEEELSGGEELAKYCKQNVRTFYHYHGGCGVGSVVDEEYRVYGVTGLRVVDGSTFLESPGTNPMATLMMLGRYQGIRILRERGHLGASTTLDHP
ncbi:(R)-mandelonitrile lyase-like isoform X2 [Rhodamnia argentea]|uniref:(R)-mandelonitrile lyase-like isoform X2 n=1 Tax=Rhodamnia argentea TaxID=178133 RepID=A0A8B8QA67_9MYRT|nr:(R)-mandelonitrile lyase-like isoform X2 [Rhodamnia argentea]